MVSYLKISKFQIFTSLKDLLIQEELLWERNNNEVKTIKQFCLDFIVEKIFKTNKDNKFELKEGANQITIDFLIRKLSLNTKFKPSKFY